MLRKTRLRLGVLSGVAIATIALTIAGPALADPAPGTFKPLVGTGSDTIQDVMGGIAFGSSNLASYDATGSLNIQTRSSTSPLFTRPNGSGNGVKALSYASTLDGSTKLFTFTNPDLTTSSVNIDGAVDYARSSSGPSNIGSDLTFIPFAKDGLTFAVNSASDFPRDIPVGSSADPTTKLTLYNIYKCTFTSYRDSEGTLIPITPLIPQSGSGTTKFFKKLLTGSESGTLGTCVKSTKNGADVQEHDGNSVTGAGDIVPFSVAQYIAQGNHSSLPTTVIERRGQVALGSISTVKPYLMSSGGGIELNADFPVVRLVFNVVETKRITTGDAGFSQPLKNAFVGTTSEVCAASATIKQYGFATIGSLCGSNGGLQAYTS